MARRLVLVAGSMVAVGIFVSLVIRVQWRYSFQANENPNYDRRYYAFWKFCGMDLPGDVLRQVYYANVLGTVPVIPSGQFSEL